MADLCSKVEKCYQEWRNEIELQDVEKAFTLQFFVCVKTSKDPISVLFDNVVIPCLTDIKKHKMRLNKLFHPDKLAHLGRDDEAKKEFYFLIENVENKMKEKFTTVSVNSEIKFKSTNMKAEVMILQVLLVTS